MLQYILLGIIQGLTEFFPVSSSAHLVIAQKVLGIYGEGLIISIVLHLGTILALLVFFFKDILALFRNIKLLFLILIVTVITGAIGISGKDFFEGLFSSVKFSAIALIVTGIILFFASKFMNGKRNNPNIKDAIILGFTQAIAIIPGISRSGITVSTLLFRGMNKEESFRFSFLASIPAVLGAVLLEAKGIDLSMKVNTANFAVGLTASFISGLFALFIFKKIISRAKLHYFGYYCIIIAILTLLFIK